MTRALHLAWTATLVTCLLPSVATPQPVSAVPGDPARSAHGSHGSPAPDFLARAAQADRLAEAGDYPAALPLAREVLAYEELTSGSNSESTARARYRLGTVLAALGEHADAIAQFEASLSTREQLHGPQSSLVGVTLTALGWSLLSSGHPARALPVYERALQALELAHGPEHEDVARVLNDIGVLYENVAQYALALPYQQRALDLRERLLGPDTGPVAQALNNLAALHEAMGQYDAAMPLYERSIAINRRVLGSEHPEVASVLQNYALLRYKMGHYDRALPMAESALAIDLKAFGEQHPNVAFDLEMIAAIYRELGAYGQALQMQERALGLLRARLGSDHRRVGAALNNMGSLYAAMGQWDQAQAYLEHALQVKEAAATPDGGSIAVTLISMGSLLRVRGQLEPARERYAQALRVGEQALGPRHDRVAEILTRLGAIDVQRGEAAAALRLLHRAVWIAELAGSTPNLWRAQHALHQAHARLGDTDLAIFWGKRSVNGIQALRGELANISLDLRRSFLSDKRSIYVSLANQLVAAGRLAEAQEVLAMLKEEELYDYVARGGEHDLRATRASYVGRAEAAAEARWDAIRGQIAAIAQESGALARKAALGLTPEEDARRRQLDADLVLANQRYDAFVADLAREFAASGQRRAQALDERQLRNLVALQDLLADTGRHSALLHYVVADQRVAIIVTTADTQIARETRVSATELNRQVLAFRQAVAARADVVPAARQLYRLLLGPVEADLRQAGVRTLLLSLDGTLRYLPFAALHDGRSWMAERYALALFTEAARLQLSRTPRRHWTMTGLGLTQAVPGFAALPAVREELEGLRRRSLPGDVYLDAQFTADRLRDALAASRPVMHIATHFQFRPGTFAQSFLVLGDGQRLSLQEIRDRRLRFAGLDLLTLSACDTAMGGGFDETGAEVEGFGALAQQQGAAAVLATLWPVADGSTSRFMLAVYGRRQQDARIGTAQALQQAQLSFVRGGGRFAHPFYWAPYVLMGNWR